MEKTIKPRKYIIQSPNATGYLSYIERQLVPYIKRNKKDCIGISIIFRSEHPGIDVPYHTYEFLVYDEKGRLDLYDVLDEIDIVVKDFLAKDISLYKISDKDGSVSEHIMDIHIERKYESINKTIAGDYMKFVLDEMNILPVQEPSFTNQEQTNGE